MSPILKKFLFVIGGLVLLIGVALAVFAASFDPNDYKEEIQAQVKTQTGRDLQLSGPLKLSVFPWLGVEANAIGLSNAAGFDDAEFARIEQVEVRLRLLPLFSGQIQLGQIGLTGLSLNLQRKADGSNNWDDLGPKQSAEKEPASVEEKSSKPLDLSIAGLDIRDARIQWRDGSAVTVIEGLNLETGPIESGKLSTMALSVALTLADKTSLDLRAEGRWLFDLAGPSARLEDFQASMTAAGDAVPGGKQSVGLTLDAAYDGQKQTAEVKNAKLEFVDQIIHLQALVTALNTGPKAHVEMNGQKIDVAKIAKALKVELPPQAASWPSLNLDMKSDADLAADKVSALALNLGFGQLNLDANAVLSSISKQSGSGIVSVKPLDLHAFLAALGYPLGLQKSPGPTSLDVQLSLAPDLLSVDKLNGQLAGEALSGKVSVKDFAKPQVRANLDLAGLKVADWAGASDEGSKGGKEQKKSKDDASADINAMQVPMDWAKDLNLTARVALSRLNAYGIKFRDVRWTADARPGSPVKQQLVANAYGGEMAINNSIDPNQPQPVMGVNMSAKALGLGDFLQDGWGSRWITGVTEFGLNLQSKGNTVGSLRSSANGDANYRLKDGEVQGVSLVDVVRKASDLINRGKASDAKAEGNSTSFSELVGKFLVESGNLRVKDFGGDNSWFKFAGDGVVDLLAGRYDLKLAPVLLENSTTKNDKTLSKLIGLAIPVAVTGPLTAPKFKVDLESLLKEKAKAEIDSKLDEKKDELRNKLNDKLGDFLRKQ